MISERLSSFNTSQKTVQYGETIRSANGAGLPYPSVSICSEAFNSQVLLLGDSVLKVEHIFLFTVFPSRSFRTESK